MTINNELLNAATDLCLILERTSLKQLTEAIVELDDLSIDMSEPADLRWLFNQTSDYLKIVEGEYES